MGFYLNLGFLLFLAIVIRSGDALRCWTCSSDLNTSCADYFNTTAYTRSYARFDSTQSLPALNDCQTGTPNIYSLNQRAVCLKKKQTTYGKTTYIRQCRFLQPDERIGACRTETTPSYITVDFCEYCDYDGCNGASGIKLNVLSALVPATFMFFLSRF